MHGADWRSGVGLGGLAVLLAAASAFGVAMTSSSSPQAALPKFSIPAGTYTTHQTIAITDATPGAKIYFTITGIEPPMPAQLYTGPITVSTSETFNAIAVAPGYSHSAVAIATYSIAPSAAAPTFSIASGTYNSALSLTISDTAPGAAIYYTVVGAAMTMPSTRYTGAISVSSSQTIYAFAAAPGFAHSPQAVAVYTIIPAAPTPLITPAAGTYSSVQTVTIADAVSGAAIYYTTDGTSPASSSQRYSGPIAVSSGTTVQAIATAPGFAPSTPASATYTISLTPPPPSFTPSTGTYIQPPSVSITNAAPGAAIYYTTDGTMPSPSSAQYTGPFAVTSSQTVNAVAVVPGYLNWGKSSATYTITPPAAAPLLSPAGGTYATPQQVSITANTPGAKIYYTTTGILPTASSAIYAGPIAVSASQTIQAIAVAPGFAQSPAVVGSFSIQGPLSIVALPVLPTAYAGAAYNATILASGEGPSYVWTVNGSPIPPGAPTPMTWGVTASNDGSYALTIGGKPTSPGTIVLNVGVSNPYSGDQAAPVTVSIPVSSPSALSLPAANPNPFPTATTHGSYFASIAASGGVPPYSWTVTGLASPLTASTSTPIATIAGSGVSGFSGDGERATQAQIGDHGGIAADGLGNVYFADSITARVRMVNSSGIISTVAGTGKAGYNGDNIAAAQAQLNSPVGLAVDRAGNLYIADAGNSRVRMVSAATGLITTLAGTGVAGYNGEGFAATIAQLNHPAGVAIDCLGNLYIADSGNARVREIAAATGMITTLAGTGAAGYSGDNGPAVQAQLNNPYALAADAQGNIYIADLTGAAGAIGTTGRIRKVMALAGAITTVAGSGIAGFNGDGIAATRAALSNPVSLAVDRCGNIYIADAGNNRVRSINAMTVIGTVAGTGGATYNGDGISAAAANIDSPQGVATDWAGNIYISDANGRIRTVLAPTPSSELIVKGTPAAAGPISFQASVQDSTGASVGPVTYSISVANPLPLAIPLANPGTLPSAVVGQPYTGTITATGGVAGYTWSFYGYQNGNKTAGISDSLAATGNGDTLIVSGTPTTAGTVTLGASVKDGLGHSTSITIYTIDVVSAPGSQVSGQVSFVSCGLPAPGITLTLHSNPIQTASTDSNGQFAFQNVPNGTFSLTPSVAAPSSVFYPASQTVVVNDGAATGVAFQAAVGYNVSGNVSYLSGVGGRIAIRLVNTSCPEASPGTNIAGATAFAIRGVQPGTYSLEAWVDELDYGALNAEDATATIPNITVGAANLTNVSVAVTQPPPVALSSAPGIVFGGGFGGGAILGYTPILAAGVEQATSYTVEWSTTASFATVIGSRTFAASGTASSANGTSVWMVNSLATYSVYYFRAQGSTQNSIGPWSNVFGPVTAGAPRTGNPVSGTVSFTGPVKGPLYLGFRDVTTGKAYAEIVPYPVSPQTYSVKVPTGSNYAMFAFVDRNGDGMADNADLNGLNNDAVVTIAGSTTQNFTLAPSNQVFVMTQHFRQAGQGASPDSYRLAFDLPTAGMTPLTVSLMSGPNVLSPFDIGECISCIGQPYDFSVDIGPAVPSAGDTYTFSIFDPSGNPIPGLGGGATVSSTAAVTGVVDAFAANLSPTTGVGAGPTPTFTWVDPANAAEYTYRFTLCDANGNVIWQIPSATSSSIGLSSAIAEITWGTDPTGAQNPPSVSSLTPGETYTWSIAVQDADGNTAVAPVNYTP